MFSIIRRGWDLGSRHKATGEASEKDERASVCPSAGVAGWAARVLSEEGGGGAMKLRALGPGNPSWLRLELAVWL